ncbi:MAG TPA: hypothetical protein VF807_05430 [Ktedonobacterales bacterium]
MATDEHRFPIEQIGDERLRQAVSIMTTEHFTLQGGRGNIISEVNGRLTIFIGALSSSLIALGFVGQSSRFGHEFRAFALSILPALLFIGIATLGRLAQCNRETALYSRGINRIRHFYGELAPDLLPYFTQSTHDDFTGDLAGMGLEWSPWQPLFFSGVRGERLERSAWGRAGRAPPHLGDPPGAGALDSEWHRCGHPRHGH